MKKNYILPTVEVENVELQQMLSVSLDLDSTPVNGDEAEVKYNSDWSEIW